MEKRYNLPEFLEGRVTSETYERWLRRKAAAHIRRDRRRGTTCTGEEFRLKIHEAVMASGGRDDFTGEELDWELLSEYNNDASKKGKRKYKRKFALLPTVDHVIAGDATRFVICAWRTNDAKNDLGLDDFKKLCKAVLLHAGYTVTEPSIERSEGFQHGRHP